jgi:Uma2 family endonuclease
MRNNRSDTIDFQEMRMFKTAGGKEIVRFNYIYNLHFPKDHRCEILNRKHYAIPTPSIKHQAVALKIAAALLRYAEARKLGRVVQAPCDVMLSKETVIQPDILFIKRERRGLIGERNLRGAPDLVVEVLSRRIPKKDLNSMRKICAHFEIPEYWVFDPNANTAETLVWSELGYISAGNYGKSDKLSSPLLPNLNLSLSRIFRD